MRNNTLYSRRWKEKNRERVKAYNQKWSEDNKDKRKIISIKYRNSKKGKLAAKLSRKRLLNDPKRKAKYYQDRENKKLQCRKWLNEQKSILGCCSCGIKDPVVLDFHHKDPKSKIKSIAQMSHCSKTVLSTEIDKCVVICSNCHRLLHSVQHSSL